MSKYKLVHITTSGEYKTPLVASQLFDQAETQAVVKGDNAPEQVHVWCITPMRDLFSKSSRDYIKKLKKRCPSIGIKLLGGIGKLKNFPLFQMLYIRRWLLNERCVIYHCRGESATKIAYELKSKFPNDKVVFDVRGLWPAELLYQKGITSIDKASGIEKDQYESAVQNLKRAVKLADGLTSVSNELRTLLINEYEANGNISWSVPCCISSIPDESKRSSIRKKWGVDEDTKVIIYSGTTAKYQHLEDLTFPFVKELLSSNTNLKFIILTPEIEKMQQLVASSGLDFERTIIYNVPQKDVTSELTGGDIGILVRQPTLVNTVANPVKIAEYLSAGLSLIVEDGVGGISFLSESPAIKFVKISQGINSNDIVQVNQWIKNSTSEKREMARQIVKNNFLWQSAIQVHRKNYKNLMKEL